VRRADLVYHIAATYREAGQPDSAYRAINVDGTRHVLEGPAGGRAEGRALQHGWRARRRRAAPSQRGRPFAPGDVYQRTKLEAELLAREFGRAGAPEVVVFRPIGIFGPGDLRFLKLFRASRDGGFLC